MKKYLFTFDFGGRHLSDAIYTSSVWLTIAHLKLEGCTNVVAVEVDI